MTLNILKNKINQKEAKIAVIGLGYVGLPVACEFARVGFDVLGVDILVDRVNRINSGLNPIEGNEPGLTDLLSEVVANGNLRSTTDYQMLHDRDIVLIDVETPVDDNNVPKYHALSSVLKSLQNVMKEGVLIIVESTIAPGTMSNLVRPTIEGKNELILNKHYFLGNCPERVMPGKLLDNLRNLSRVVGGMTAETAETMVSLYQNVVHADLDPTDCITAELVKTTENAYRDVQIAFANEVALICEALGADIWKVRELVNKSPYRQMHLPGAGVGGHCIPKDPWLLAYGVQGKNVPLRMIPSARAVNDAMPMHVADITRDLLTSQGLDFSNARILVMGFSYLEDTDDTRNSPSEVLVEYLSQVGAEVLIHDPFIADYQEDWKRLAQGSDAVIVMVKHSEYYNIDLEELKSLLRTPILIDGRGIYEKNKVEKAGLAFGSVGQPVFRLI